MKDITFIDLEVSPDTRRIADIGAVRSDGTPFHANAVDSLIHFLGRAEYMGGHNILKHDLKYLAPLFEKAGYRLPKVIDTLYLSPLLFPAKPYHHLLKDDKLQTDSLNNPLNDSLKARDLFLSETEAFCRLDETLKNIYYSLLHDTAGFSHFFDYVGYSTDKPENLPATIFYRFDGEICASVPLADLIARHPAELAYCLALINCEDRYSITPPWVLRNFPEVEPLMNRLRNKPCLTGCDYCNQAFDIHRGLKKHFGFNAYRTYDGQPLQDNAVQAAVEGKSILAVFPTGGGKSITFQVPALMSGERVKGLTVIISPLQSLMKDQVDNLRKNNITEAVTINGLLDPVERAQSFERVEDGSASLLYISPESLRSKTIERLLLGRKVVRFVIDEAHCFSAWGQDFRVDYLYIGDFIKQLQEKKRLAHPIPVSCFTATAKQKVIEDIADYFREKLGIHFEMFRSGSARTNLRYKVFEWEEEDAKYDNLRRIIQEHNCPTIVYVSRTRTASKLAERLGQDGFSAKSFHGKMDTKEKTENQPGHMVVIAGPGSGKTRLLVHKLASLLLMEDVKHEQLLMLTFSRAAAGDDDQNIFGFRNSDPRYMKALINTYGARTHELLVNFRSRNNLVLFANCFAGNLTGRMKHSPIVSRYPEDGVIHTIRYKSPNIIVPLVDNICNSPLSGTTCVLTQTNEEALQIARLLQEKNMSVRLTQSNGGFRLCDLNEIRHFNRLLELRPDLHLIEEDKWEEAKRNLKTEFGNTPSWEVCRGIILNFEQLYRRKYRSDWEIYLFESKLEDFYASQGETIIASTIHSAKGKEFDNVFLLLEDIRTITADKLREIYVAITRAKQNLCIHLNEYFQPVIPEDYAIVENNSAIYPVPERLPFSLTHKEVWLDFFLSADRQKAIANLKSGTPLLLIEGGCADASGREIIHFSSSFKTLIDKWRAKGYEAKEAIVRFIVYWKKQEDNAKEVRIVLAEVVLERRGSSIFDFK